MVLKLVLCSSFIPTWVKSSCYSIVRQPPSFIKSGILTDVWCSQRSYWKFTTFLNTQLVSMPSISQIWLQDTQDHVIKPRFSANPFLEIILKHVKLQRIGYRLPIAFSFDDGWWLIIIIPCSESQPCKPPFSLIPSPSLKLTLPQGPQEMGLNRPCPWISQCNNSQCLALNYMFSWAGTVFIFLYCGAPS